jgi:hypothetical protein
VRAIRGTFQQCSRVTADTDISVGHQDVAPPALIREMFEYAAVHGNRSAPGLSAKGASHLYISPKGILSSAYHPALSDVDEPMSAKTHYGPHCRHSQDEEP